MKFCALLFYTGTPHVLDTAVGDKGGRKKLAFPYTLTPPPPLLSPDIETKKEKHVLPVFYTKSILFLLLNSKNSQILFKIENMTRHLS